jgi:hypothetical protein
MWELRGRPVAVSAIEGRLRGSVRAHALSGLRRHVLGDERRARAAATASARRSRRPPGAAEDQAGEAPHEAVDRFVDAPQILDPAGVDLEAQQVADAEWAEQRGVGGLAQALEEFAEPMCFTTAAHREVVAAMLAGRRPPADATVAAMARVRIALAVVALSTAAAAAGPAAAPAANPYHECQKPVVTGVEIWGLHDVGTARACRVALSFYRWENASATRTNELYGCRRPTPSEGGTPYLKLRSWRGWTLSIVGRYEQFTMSRGRSSFHLGGTDFPLNCS